MVRKNEFKKETNIVWRFGVFIAYWDIVYDFIQ